MRKFFALTLSIVLILSFGAVSSAESVSSYDDMWSKG